MKKFLKIAAVVVLLLVVAAVGAGLYVWRGVKAVPAFYERKPLDGQERLAAIESVERKVLNLQGVLDRAYARGQAAADGNLPATQSADGVIDDPTGAGGDDDEPIAVAFTGPELDTYFRKWLEESGYSARLGQYMSDPRIAVVDGRVVLAGQMSEYDAIVSLHFLPSVDEQGAVRLKLDGIYAGRIALPNMAFEKFRVQTVAALEERMPQFRQAADITPEGFANEAAILASSQGQLIELFDGREIEPLIAFLPLPGRGFVAARVSELSVNEEELVLGVTLLDAAQRADLLEQIRAEPESVAKSR